MDSQDFSSAIETEPNVPARTGVLKISAPRLWLSAAVGAAAVGLALPFVAYCSWLLLDRGSVDHWRNFLDFESSFVFIVAGSALALPVALFLGAPALLIISRYSHYRFWAASIVGTILGAGTWLGIPMVLGVSFNPNYLLFGVAQGALLGAIGGVTSAWFLFRNTGLPVAPNAA